MNAKSCLLAGCLVFSAARVCSGQAPPNDNFANSIALTGLTNAVTGSNLGATAEPGEPNHAFQSGGKSVWWNWVAPTNGGVTITTAGSDFDTVLAVYTGTSVSNLVLIGFNDQEPGGGNTSYLVFSVVGGATYQIAVDGYRGASGSIALALDLVPPPANDNFANRITITGVSNTVTGSNVGATPEPGEPIYIYGPSANQTTQSVWWSWTAPTNGSVTITTRWSDFDALVVVYQGTSVTNLGFISDSTRTLYGLAEFQAVAGITYQIRVSGFLDPFGNITLNLALAPPVPIVPPPANDDFANRIAITGISNTVTGLNIGATTESGEPYITGYPGAASVWWTWTAPTNGGAIITTTGSDFDTLLAVYTGTSVSNLVLIAGNDNDGYSGRTTSRVVFNTVAGTTYPIAVAGGFYDSGNITLNIVMPPAPPNDNFANSITIVGFMNTVTGSNVNATKEPGEPDHANYPGGKSVWWNWTAPISGTATITTEESDFTAAMAVYTGASVSNLTLLASNYCCSTSLGSVVAGTTYQIAVDGLNFGRIKLTLTATPLPANDDFANRISIIGTNTTITGWNIGATKEPGETNHAGNPGGRSVWWSWTAPTSGNTMIRTAGSDFDTLLAVYTGSSVSGLTLITNNDEYFLGRTSQVRFQAVSGTTYQIAVDGYYGAFGNVTLNVGMPPAPANDNFADATLLTGSSIIFSGSLDGATVENGEPLDCTAGDTDPSAWYAWTASESTWVTIETIDVALHFGGYFVGLTVYTGTNLASLVPVACNYLNNDWGRYLTLPVTNGTTLHFQVTDHFSLASFKFRLITSNSPVILEQPTSFTVLPNEGVLFKVLAARERNGPIAYQWRFNAVNLRGENYPMLARFVTSTNQVGGYSVVVSNSAGMTTSAVATLSVNPMDVNPLLTAIRPSLGGQFDFSLSGEIGRSYFVESSPNLIQWFAENSFRHRHIESKNFIFNTNAAGLLSVPQDAQRKFFRAYRRNIQTTVRTQQCLNQLRQIEFAKDLWAIENRKGAGDQPTHADLFGASLYIPDELQCPLDHSDYSITAIGQLQTCVNAAVYGHVLTEPQY